MREQVVEVLMKKTRGDSKVSKVNMICECCRADLTGQARLTCYGCGIYPLCSDCAKSSTLKDSHGPVFLCEGCREGDSDGTDTPDITEADIEELTQRSMDQS